MNEETKPGFRITKSRGFHITFANGYAISVQFGDGNYCSNYDKFLAGKERSKYEDVQSTNAEIAIIKDGKFVTKEILKVNEDVIGYVTPEQLLKMLGKFIMVESL